MPHRRDGTPIGVEVPPGYLPLSMLELLGIDTILTQLVFALGLAIVLGNGYALYKNRRGERPQGAEEGAQLRMGRVAFLMVIGTLMSIWGAVSLFIE